MGKEGENKEFRRVEKQFEIRMYGLLIIVLAAVFLSLAIGYFAGTKIGGSIEKVEVETPNYCNFDKEEGKIIVTCNEVNLTASDLCRVTSSGIRDNLRVVVIGQK